MSNYKVNGMFLQHSTPEYNAAHRKENSEYNAKYYQAHKEKWGVKSDSKSGSDSDKDDDDKDKKKKKSGKSIEEILSKFNGGSKAIGKGSKKSSKSSSESKKKTDEEKAEEKRKKAEEREAAAKNRKELQKAAAKRQKEALEKRKRQQAYIDRRRKEITEERKKKERERRSKTYVVTVRGKSSSKRSRDLNHMDLDPNFLVHHGIDNQKWGVRHGPPYPLAREISSAIKKGASKGLKEGRKNAVNYAVQGTVRPVSDRLQKKKNPQKFDAKKLATGALVIVGSAVATGVLTKLVDYGIDKAAAGGKIAVGNILMRAPHEGLANVGVNMLLNAARTTRR